MSKISVIGLGPGGRDYILPASLKAVSACDVIVGAKRNLDILSEFSNKKVCIEGRLMDSIEYIKDSHNTEKIGVVVSGDVGFHSLLRYLKKNLDGIEIEVFTGLSSMSLMFSRLKLMYDDAIITSLHGRSDDIVKLISENSKVGFLTDKDHSPKYIAKALYDKGIKDKTIAVGERLSYGDEVITKLSIEQALTFKADKLCVVVVVDNDIQV